MTVLVQISTNQSNKETTMNENLRALAPAALFGKKHTTTTGLTFGYYGGILLVDGVLTSVADGTVALTASVTNYVEATRAGVVSKNVTSFTAGQIPLFTVLTTVSAIDTVTDYRAWATAEHVGSYLAKSFPSDADITLTAAEARAKIIVFGGTISTVRQVVVPPFGLWIMKNATLGSPSSSIRIIGQAGSPQGGSVTIAPGMTMTVYGDGNNINSATAAV